MSQIRRAAARGRVAQGDTFEVVRTFSHEETLAFGRLTRDYNPVHYDDEFAAGKGLAGPILHGLLTAAMVCEVGGQLAWLASGMSFRFVRPVLAGDTITMRMTITALDGQGRAKAEAEFTNQRGELVQSGELYGRLPGPADGQRLERMMAQGDPTNPLFSPED